jgi:hypothetical protein
MSYYFSFLIIQYLIFYGLKYTERPHVREKGRYIGLYINKILGEFKYSKYTIGLLTIHLLEPLVTLLDIITGIIEGIGEIKPLIEFTKIELENQNIDIKPINDICDEEPIKIQTESSNIDMTENNLPVNIIELSSYNPHLEIRDISDEDIDMDIDTDIINDTNADTDTSPMNKFGDSTSLSFLKNKNTCTIEKINGKKLRINIPRKYE